MTSDPSRGWNAAAAEFIAARSHIGVDVIRRWAKTLPAGGAVLDVGCGSGAPVTATLIEAGLRVWGIDASEALVAEFRRRFPSAQVACEPAETSALFGRTFEGAVAIGLIFLLPEDDQRKVIVRVARALAPGGRFLFSAPQQVCDWTDNLTGQPSRSLGEEAYRSALGRAGLNLIDHHVDEGENHYFEAVRGPSLSLKGEGLG